MSDSAEKLSHDQNRPMHLYELEHVSPTSVFNEFDKSDSLNMFAKNDCFKTNMNGTRKT